MEYVELSVGASGIVCAAEYLTTKYPSAPSTDAVKLINTESL